VVAHVLGLQLGGRLGSLAPLLHGTNGLLVLDLLHGGLAMVLLVVIGGLLGAIAHLHGLHCNLGGFMADLAAGMAVKVLEKPMGVGFKAWKARMAEANIKK